jgi:hypothetical protein
MHPPGATVGTVTPGSQIRDASGRLSGPKFPRWAGIATAPFKSDTVRAVRSTVDPALSRYDACGPSSPAPGGWSQARGTMETMTSQARGTRPLQIWPCQSICVWKPTGEALSDAGGGGLHLFACVGCASEWVRTEPWTPIDSAGTVPSAVAAERDRSTTWRGEDAVGTVGT